MWVSDLVPRLSRASGSAIKPQWGWALPTKSAKKCHYLVCRFGDYLAKNKSRQIHIERLVTMTFCVIAYETAEFEVVMGMWKGSQERAIHHARRRARWFEQDITAIRVVGVGLTNEEALALLHSASPLTDGVKVF